MSKSIDRVKEFLKSNGINCEIKEFSETTRTALDAANAIGCEVGQIIKSLVFLADGKPIILLVSGDRRAIERKVENCLGVSKVERADADTAREMTGFAVGGIPPFAHKSPIKTLMDKDVLRYKVLYVAAGTPHSIFPINVADLERLTGATVSDIAG